MELITHRNPILLNVPQQIYIAVIFLLLIFHYYIPSDCYSDDITTTQQSHFETLQPNKVQKIEFVIDELPVTDIELQNNLTDLTNISIGSNYSRYAIQSSVASIFSQQEYSQIDVYTIYTQNGVIIKYKLVKMMILKEVIITGVSSDELNRTIASEVKLKPDDKYVPTIANDDAVTIKELCADWGYFDVRVDIIITVASGTLTYQVTLGNPTFVTEFVINGNASIFTEHIKDVCNTHLKQIYRQSKVDEDRKAIHELYRNRYYPSNVVESTFNHDSGLLTYQINEGKQLLLDYVDENGKTILQETFLNKLLSVLDIDTEEPERDQLRKKLEPLIHDRSRWDGIVKAHFEAKGYHGTEVVSKTLTNSPLHIEFTIKHGTRYFVSSVEFTGNEAFSNEELLREMVTKPTNIFSKHFRKRYFSDFGLDTDINRLEILYEKAGYRNVKITSKLDKQDDNKQRDGEISIKLSIFEPTKEVINRCLFKGNSVLDTLTLYNALPSKPPEPNAPLVQKKYENAILKAYQDRGYFYAKAEKIEYKHKTDVPVFQIEGDYTQHLNAGRIPPKLIDAFHENNLTLSGAFIATSIGVEWSIQDVHGNARYTLEQEKEHLSVYQHGILQFDIVEGDRIIFGKFNFVGDPGVVPSVLYREVSGLQGTLLTTEKLDRVIQNLYNTRIFEPGIQRKLIPPKRNFNQTSNLDNDIIPVNSLSIQRVNDIEISLQHRLPRTYGASVGYGTSDGPRGTIAFSHFNLFRRNIRFHLRGRWGTRGYLYDTTVTEPWLIGRTSGSLQFLGRKLEEDDGVRALQGSFTFSRKLARSHRLNLQYSYRYLKDTSIVESSITQLIPIPSTTVSSLSFLWRQDSRVPSLNPRSGMLNEVTVEYAGGVLGGESGFVKIVSDTEYHKQLNSRGYVLSTALQLGYTPGLQTNKNDEEELISFERFWAGGSTTVRGYEERGLGPEDSTGKHRGNVQFIFKTELRFPIFDPFQGVMFYDTGNVWGSVEDIEYKWLPSSVGLGLRLNFGPLILGVDYAVPITTLDDVPTVPFYFRIGSSF